MIQTKTKTKIEGGGARNVTRNRHLWEVQGFCLVNVKEKIIIHFSFIYFFEGGGLNSLETNTPLKKMMNFFFL